MTALPLPGFLQGKNCTLMSTRGYALSAGGVLTPDSVIGALDLSTLGTFDTWEYAGTFNGFERHPANGQVENWLGTTDGFEITVGEITPNEAQSSLMTIWANFNYIRFEANWKSPAGANTFKLAAIVTRAGGSIRTGIVEGENGTIATYKPAGVFPYYGFGSPPF